MITKSRRVTSSAHFLVAVWLVLIGVALLIDLAVYIHFWSDWNGLPSDYRADSNATFGRALVEGVSVVVLLVGAATWGVSSLFIRPAYREYVRTHKGQPLSAKTMRRIAGALVMTAVFGAAYFGSFAFLGRLGYDSRSVPCLDFDSWGCYEYSPPSDGGAWLWVAIAQVIALTGMLVFLGLACAPLRGREPRLRVLSALGPRAMKTAWMSGAAVTVIVDLAVYIWQRIEWAGL
ncbi:MAG: hypothetical protein JW722_00720 [Demequinaceae bacterium]|nr:hypothetical protein [Demequinaceae bacterium]